MREETKIIMQILKEPRFLYPDFEERDKLMRTVIEIDGRVKIKEAEMISIYKLSIKFAEKILLKKCDGTKEYASELFREFAMYHLKTMEKNYA